MTQVMCIGGPFHGQTIDITDDTSVLKYAETTRPDIPDEFRRPEEREQVYYRHRSIDGRAVLVFGIEDPRVTGLREMLREAMS